MANEWNTPPAKDPEIYPLNRHFNSPLGAMPIALLPSSPYSQSTTTAPFAVVPWHTFGRRTLPSLVAKFLSNFYISYAFNKSWGDPSAPKTFGRYNIKWCMAKKIEEDDERHSDVSLKHLFPPPPWHCKWEFCLSSVNGRWWGWSEDEKKTLFIVIFSANLYNIFYQINWLFGGDRKITR